MGPGRTLHLARSPGRRRLWPAAWPFFPFRPICASERCRRRAPVAAAHQPRARVRVGRRLGGGFARGRASPRLLGAAGSSAVGPAPGSGPGFQAELLACPPPHVAGRTIFGSVAVCWENKPAVASEVWNLPAR